MAAVLAHLPDELRPAVQVAYITGWRIHSEVLPLEWRRVDFGADEIRLDAGTTKNGDGRVFPITAALRRVLEAQQTERKQLQQAGHVVPWVFWRMVAKGRGGPKRPVPITRFDKAWRAACRAAGCPGRIPHDMRRTAVRNLVRAGVPQTVAMKMTGHKTDSVFRRYDIVSESDLRDAARRLAELLGEVLPDTLGRQPVRALLDNGVVIARRSKPTTDVRAGERFGRICPADLVVAGHRFAANAGLPLDPSVAPAELEKGENLGLFRHLQVIGHRNPSRDEPLRMSETAYLSGRV